MANSTYTYILPEHILFYIIMSQVMVHRHTREPQSWQQSPLTDVVQHGCWMLKFFIIHSIMYTLKHCQNYTFTFTKNFHCDIVISVIFVIPFLSVQWGKKTQPWYEILVCSISSQSTNHGSLGLYVMRSYSLF